MVHLCISSANGQRQKSKAVRPWRGGNGTCCLNRWDVVEPSSTASYDQLVTGKWVAELLPVHRALQATDQRAVSNSEHRSSTCSFGPSLLSQQVR